MMAQEQKPIKDQEDLEGLLGDNMAADQGSEEFVVGEVPPLWRYVAGVYGEKAVNFGKSVAHAAKRTGLYMLAGGLREKTQLRLEEKLGTDVYNATSATHVNAWITMPLVYTGAALYTWTTGLSEGWKIGLTIGLGFYGLIESGVRSIIAHDDKQPLGNTLFGIAGIVGQKIGGFFKGGLDEARERRDRDMQSKYTA